MGVYTFKMSGIARREHYDGYTDEVKTYIYEANSFQKAVTKAKIEALRQLEREGLIISEHKKIRRWRDR